MLFSRKLRLPFSRRNSYNRMRPQTQKNPQHFHRSFNSGYTLRNLRRRNNMFRNQYESNLTRTNNRVNYINHPVYYQQQPRNIFLRHKSMRRKLRLR